MVRGQVWGVFESLTIWYRNTMQGSLFLANICGCEMEKRRGGMGVEKKILGWYVAVMDFELGYTVSQRKIPGTTYEVTYYISTPVVTSLRLINAKMLAEPGSRHHASCVDFRHSPTARTERGDGARAVYESDQCVCILF